MSGRGEAPPLNRLPTASQPSRMSVGEWLKRNGRELWRQGMCRRGWWVWRMSERYGWGQRLVTLLFAALRGGVWWLFVSVALEEIGEHHLFEALGYVDGLVVDAVLYGVLFDEVGLADHGFAIFFGHLSGLHFESAAALKVDELGGSVGVVEVYLVAVVQDVE